MLAPERRLRRLRRRVGRSRGRTCWVCVALKPREGVPLPADGPDLSPSSGAESGGAEVVEAAGIEPASASARLQNLRT